MNHSSFYRVSQKQAEKLKSHEMKEGWMKNDEGWWFQADEGLRGFNDRQTTFVNVVTFATENSALAPL